MTTPPPYDPSSVPPPQGDGQPPAGAYGPPAPPAQLSEPEQRTWGMLVHLAGILGIIVTVIIWAIQKDKGAFIRDQATEALNFQILVTIAYVACWILVFVAIGAFLYPLVWIANVVFCVIAGMAANKGQLYRYPINWRLVK